MHNHRIQIGIDKKYQSDENILINIDEIPFATALFFTRT